MPVMLQSSLTSNVFIVSQLLATRFPRNLFLMILGVAADLSGAIGSGTGILKAAIIIYGYKSYCCSSVEYLLIHTFRLGNRHALVGWP